MRIEEKKLKLNKQYDNRIPQIVLGDPVRINQVLLNLLSNAIKFTHQGGKIRIGTNLLQQDEEKTSIEFMVSDTGIGISDTKIERIFEDFQQATSGTSRLYGGTGLGLAIVKQLVEPQGGTITVTSKLGEGSTFSFVLSFQKTLSSAHYVF